MTLPAGSWFVIDQSSSSAQWVDDANSTENDGWTTVSVRAGWSVNVGQTALAPFVGVHNIFDDRYVGALTVNASFGRYYEPAPGRNAYLGMTVTY